jgi:antitoxin FitA
VEAKLHANRMYTGGVGKPLQIRDVPDEVLEVLKRRAAREGASLSSYALGLLTWHASHADMAEFVDWPAITDRPISRESILRAIHEGREEEERRLDRVISRRRRGR